MTKLIIELEVSDTRTGKELAGQLITGEVDFSDVMAEGPYTITVDGESVESPE